MKKKQPLVACHFANTHKVKILTKKPQNVAKLLKFKSLRKFLTTLRSVWAKVFRLRL